MKITLIIHGNPYEIPVGLGDSLLSVIEIAVDQQRVYSFDEVKKWELRDEEGNLVSMNGQVSDLCILGNIKLFLFPKPGVAA